MIIHIKNKDTLIVKNFKFKCCIGSNGSNKKKIEGDKSTPKGIFKLGKLYYRSDRVSKPNTKLKCKKITSTMGWCNDSFHKKYNKEVHLSKNIKCEKLYRKDYKYNYFILIKYNYSKTIDEQGTIRANTSFSEYTLSFKIITNLYHLILSEVFYVLP